MNIGTLARVLAILIGTVSAAWVAVSGFQISIDEQFFQTLAALHDLIGTILLPLERIIVDPVTSSLRRAGFVISIQEHWKSVFVLLWLYTAYFTRTVAPVSELNLGNAADRSALAEPFSRWTVATLFSLVGSILAGTVPLNDLAVLWWPVAAFFAIWACNFFIDAVFRQSSAESARGISVVPIPVFFSALAVGYVQLPTLWGSPVALWWPIAAWFLFWGGGSFTAALFQPSAVYIARGLTGILMTAAFGLLGVGALPTPRFFQFEHTQSPGLLGLATFVIFIGAWYVVIAALFPPDGERPYWERWFNSPPVQTALNVFAVLGATVIVITIGRALL